MYNGRPGRKKVLIDHGFRLPSGRRQPAAQGEEFTGKAHQTIFVFGHPRQPGSWSRVLARWPKQVIVPTGE